MFGVAGKTICQIRCVHVTHERRGKFIPFRVVTVLEYAIHFVYHDLL